jgi:adenylate cyclase
LAIQDALSVGENGMRLRVGVNLGDIIIEEDGDVLGEGVNIAARLEQMADPGGVLVSGKIYEEVEGKIDRCFESRGEQQVRNIVRPVRVYALAGAGTQPLSKPLPLPDRPSIAVLPFTNMSGDPEQQFLADGMVEEIISALSRVRSFFVISRNSTFTYKGRAVDPRSAFFAYRPLTAAYANANRVEEARRALTVLLRAYPGLTISQALGSSASSGADFRKRLADGLRMAGLQE